MAARKSGRIDLIFGPMFSGKTSDLLNRIRRYKIANKKCVVVKYSLDTRYHDSDISSHDFDVHEAVCAKQLSDVEKLVIDSDVIGIDEGQFYPDIIDFCEKNGKFGKNCYRFCFRW